MATKKKTGKGSGSDKTEEESRESETSEEREEAEAASEEMKDERDLSIDDKVARINEIYDINVLHISLKVGLYVIRNVFSNDLEAASSKNPKKNLSFKAIAEHKDLDPDLKGPTLRRWVAAAAARQQLEGAGITTVLLTYSHLRELSKISDAQAREKVARDIINKEMTAREAQKAVQEAISEGKHAEEPSDEEELCGLAREIMKKLDDPVSLSEEADYADILLDGDQVRQEFNFREQTKIYDKAEKIKNSKLKERTQLEERLEAVGKSVDFLEDVMKTFDGKEADTETAA